MIDIRETTFYPSIGVPRVDVLSLLFFILFLKGVIEKYETKQIKKSADDNSNFCRPSELTQSFDAP